MKILVTGGAGYIGSVVSALLQEAGHELVVVDDLSEGYADAIPEGITFVQADITQLGNILQAHPDTEAVVHLAAFISVGESARLPERYWQNNVMGTLHVLDAMRTHSVKKLLFASTAAVYGNPDTTPITEDMPTRPTNTYGMTKLTMDMAITSECLAHGLAATSVRFFNVAGAYSGHGERHQPETHIIPLALAAAAEGQAFTINGDDYPTPDGTCIRDYVHVADLAKALLLALDKLKPGQHTLYNLGNGTGFSNKQIVAAVEKITGKQLDVRFGPRREGDPAILIASSQKIQTALGWQPEHPDIETMVADAWALRNSQA